MGHVFEALTKVNILPLGARRMKRSHPRRLEPRIQPGQSDTNFNARVKSLPLWGVPNTPLSLERERINGAIDAARSRESSAA